MMTVRSLSMKALLSLALVALSGAAAAQSGQPAAGTATTARKIPSLSEAGNAIYAKTFGTPDPQLLTISRQQRTVRASLMSLAMGAKVDVDKLADLLKQQQTLQDQFRARQNELTVTMLRQLTDEDRGIYLRYSLTPVVPNPAVPAR
jgi:septal ring factor EnvC (AmiA/AmiB activator)